jgi:hypothetical protein
MLIFDHIPKTGGTTFIDSCLSQAFRPEELFIVGNDDRETEHERFRTMAHDERSRLRVVAGHYMEYARAIEPQATFISIVRDPVQRVTSSYLHTIHYDAQYWTDQISRLPTLEEYVKSADDTFVNLQSRILLGCKEQSLTDEEIRKQLSRRFKIIGITDQYDRFMFYLHRRLAVPLWLYNKQRARQERSSLQVGPSIVQTILDDNAMDVRTYQIACKMFNEQFDGLMTPLDWKVFDLYERCLDVFRAVTDNDDNSNSESLSSSDRATLTQSVMPNVCLTTGQISLLVLTVYYDLLTNILSGKANYAALVTKAAWWSRNGQKITLTGRQGGEIRGLSGRMGHRSGVFPGARLRAFFPDMT